MSLQDSNQAPEWLLPVAAPLIANALDPESNWAANPNGNDQSSLENQYAKQYIDETTKQLLSTQHILLRICYLLTSIGLMVAAIFDILKGGLENIFISGYVIFFSCILCCFELNLDSITKYCSANFGFLFSISFKFPFLLFISGMAFSFGLSGYITMSFLLAVGVYHIYVIYKYPQYESYVYNTMMGSMKA